MTLTPPRTPAPATGLPHLLLRRRRTVRDVVRGLVALLALAAMVVGTPLVLTVVAPVQLAGLRVPGWDEIAAALLRPDDGTLLLSVLTVVAWVSWALFTVTVLAEAVAQVRGLPSLRLPGLGGVQRPVAVLVAAVTVMLAPAASDADTAHAVPAATATAPVVPGGTGSVIGETSATAGGSDVVRDRTTPAPVRSHPTSRTAPQVRVRSGDSLWELAERHLGSGLRYGEIAELNYGRPQPDGHTLTHEHWIHPGWTLLLPADATNLPEPHAAQDEYTVRPGDTLSGIAADHLGDPDRYPEIASLNAGRPQPDGATLTDPDLIRPGWHLRLPTDASPAEPDRRHRPTRPHPIPPRRRSGLARGADTPTRPVARRTATDADTAAARRRRPPRRRQRLRRVPRRGDDPRPRRRRTVTGAEEDDWDLRTPITALLAGLGAIAAAGVIREVALRRRRGQRRRRPGERLPAISARAADTDRGPARPPPTRHPRPAPHRPARPGPHLPRPAPAPAADRRRPAQPRPDRAAPRSNPTPTAAATRPWPRSAPSADAAGTSTPPSSPGRPTPRQPAHRFTRCEERRRTPLITGSSGPTVPATVPARTTSTAPATMPPTPAPPWSPSAPPAMTSS